jgi:hypothetical protein
MSANDQFNEQYTQAIETIQSRAIWRIGEARVAGERFRCTCVNCGYESQHERLDVTRHRLLFGKSIREVERPRVFARCTRCGQEQHARDIGELVVPSTIRLADDVRLRTAHYRSALAAGAMQDGQLPALLDAIAALCEEASGPVRVAVFGEIAADPTSDEREPLEALGRALFLTSAQIGDVLGTVD